MAKATLKRSFLKGVVWFLIRGSFLLLVSFILTGSIEIAGLIGVIYHSAGVIMYFFHERLWARISWGYKDE